MPHLSGAFFTINQVAEGGYLGTLPPELLLQLHLLRDLP